MPGSRIIEVQHFRCLTCIGLFFFLLQESINSSLLNLLTYPWIEKRVNEGTLNLHGGYYNFVDCTFEKWTLVYREGLKGGSKYAIKNRSSWSWPMKALFTWVNFTLPPSVQHGFALPLRCSFPLHLAPFWYWCSAEGSPCIKELLRGWLLTSPIVMHGTVPLAWYAWSVCCIADEYRCIDTVDTETCDRRTKPQWGEVQHNEQCGSKVKVCRTAGEKVNFSPTICMLFSVWKH